MRFTVLGKTDLLVPAVSFGAWAAGGWMWGGSDDDAVIRAIHAAIDHGMYCIDTAPAYGMGHSEMVVGKALVGRRHDIVVATKCGLRWDLAEGEFYFDTVDLEGVPRKIYRNLRPESIRLECENSLRRLRVDCIDLYQCHWPDPTTPIEDTMTALLRLKQEGKIRAIGVSNFTPEMMDECLKYGVLDSDQPRYSALDRGIEQEILPFCRDRDISVLVYSPLEQALLTGKVTPDRIFPPDDQRHRKPLFSRENRIKILDMLESLRPIAEAHDATFGQLFIAWVLAQPGVTSALVGARTEAQAIENARAADIELTKEQEQQIRRHVEAFSLNP